MCYWVGIVYIYMLLRGSYWCKFVIICLVKFLKGKVILYLYGVEFCDFYWDECNMV